MVDLQELISRGRFIFSSAPKRLEVFNLINGKRSSKEIARKTARALSSVIQDIEKLRDIELIQEKRNSKNEILRKEGAIVYEKTPLIKHVSISFFNDIADTAVLVKNRTSKRIKASKLVIHVPSENEILDICKHGEDQLYEFKAPGTETDKITREIAAFLHTKGGGMIFYGIDDDGIIIGTDIRRQDFDQRIQNSIRYTISPQPAIEIKERNVMGSAVLLVMVQPWDRKTIYQYTKDGRYYVRRGTNVFALKPDEIKSLSHGHYLV